MFRLRSAALIFLFFTVPGLIVLSPAQVELRPSASVSHALAFVESSDALGKVDRQQVSLVYSLLAQRLKLPQKDLPHVMVFHVSSEAAHAGDVKTTSVRRNAAGKESVYYEFWIVGQPKPTDYIRYLDAVLEQHFNLNLTTEEQNGLGMFVLRFMSSTVSANGGH
jgi:hypothetical protein